jgi:hypothetical protein
MEPCAAGRTLFIDPATGAVVVDLPRFIERAW